MKKAFPLILSLLLLLSACTAAPQATKTAPETAASSAATAAETLPESAGTAIPELPEPELPELPELFFFTDGGRATYEKITTYSAPLQANADFGSFGVAPDVTPDGRKTYVSLWDAGRSAYPGLGECKTGFVVTFVAAGETREVELLYPSDAIGDFNEFLDFYLYDDYANAGKGWYSHLTENDFTDSTLITSIKITGRARAAEVRLVSLSVFLVHSGGRRTAPVTLVF